MCASFGPGPSGGKEPQTPPHTEGRIHAALPYTGKLPVGSFLCRSFGEDIPFGSLSLRFSGSLVMRITARTSGEGAPLRKKNVMYVIGKNPRLPLGNVHGILPVKTGPAQREAAHHGLQILDFHITQRIRADQLADLFQ